MAKVGPAAMIEFDNLSKRFGKIAAVTELSLTVRDGEVLGLLGPNGAGKTTAMRMATGFVRPDGGTARICGLDIRSDRLTAQRRIGYLPEGVPLYRDMTVRGFLTFVGEVRGLFGGRLRRACERTIALVELASVLERPIETLSKGFCRRVGLAQAILHDPPVLILDEPTEGLDPNQKRVVRRLVREMAANKTIVISTHLLDEVEAVCSRAVILNRGVVVADDRPAELARKSPGGRLEDLFYQVTSASEET
jgi:ABC-2 type transport system ATP-binding protein